MDVININTFKSSQPKRVFNTYHTNTCKSQWIIYLLECTQCNPQYVGKLETSFNIMLNNNRKDVSNTNAIPACVHFGKEGYNFIQYVKFTLIGQITKMVLKLPLKQR